MSANAKRVGYEYRSRVHPRGFVNRWLAVGPFPIVTASGAQPDAETNRLARLGGLGPRTHPIPTDELGWLRIDPPAPGDEVRFRGVGARWTLIDAGRDHTVSLFDRFTPRDNCVAYLYAQIESKDAVAAFRLRVERGAEIWIDGEPRALLYGAMSKLGSTLAETWLPVVLPPGRHEIIVKCWQCRATAMNGWALQLQLIDINERPIEHAEIIVPARNEAEVRSWMRQAEAERTALPSDVPVGERITIWTPPELGVERIRMRLANHDVNWEGDAATGLGPVTPELADQIIDTQLELLDAHGAMLATLRRELIVPPIGPAPADSVRAVLEAIAKTHGQVDTFSCAAGLVASYALGQHPDDPLALMQPALRHIAQKRDCSDFALLWLLRWRRLFGAAPGAAPLAAAVDESLRGFVYAPQDSDAHLMCMVTENHRAAFWTCELLAGEQMPGERFTVTGETGAWHAARARQPLLNWITEKMRYGYKEWGCPYLAVDLDLLCNLRDFCQDEQVAQAAEELVVKTLLLLVNDAFEGILAGSQSRAYAQALLAPNVARPAADIFALLGDPFARPKGNPFAIGLATALRAYPTWLNRGLNPPGDTLLRSREGKAPESARRMIYRTPHAALASAQINPRRELLTMTLPWCASLPGGIQVFSTHPGPGHLSHHHRCNYWSGTITAPRLGQGRSALLCVYDISPFDPWGYTHAYWPTARFDETREAAGWHFGRAGSGYVALRPVPGGRLITEGPYAGRELIATGCRNGWVCQIGGGPDRAAFEAFCASVCAARLSFDDDHLIYESPTDGLLDLTRNGEFTVEGEAVTWPPELHIETPWAYSRWGEGTFNPGTKPTVSAT